MDDINISSDMEIIKAVKVYYIKLNTINSEDMAEIEHALFSFSYMKIKKCVDDKEPWKDTQTIQSRFTGVPSRTKIWYKTYKKGSMLEWYNPPPKYFGTDNIQFELVDIKDIKKYKARYEQKWVE
jgi:hypothetical protein